MTKEPRPLTIKQERFCLVYFETGNATEAYRQAYNAASMSDKTIQNNAYKLISQHNGIKTRVAGLKTDMAKETGITIDSLCEKLDDDRKLARALKQPAAAISAVMGQAKLHGLIDRDTRRDGAGFEVFGTRAERDGLLRQLLGAPEAITVVDMTAGEPDKP